MIVLLAAYFGMRAAKVTASDYIQFLLAAQQVFSCCEAARCQPAQSDIIAHDAFTRLLARLPPDTVALWQEVEPLVNKQSGLLVLDDTTLDKPHARKMDLVTRHWSGKHRQVVTGINLMTLLWTDGQAAVPCDCRLYEKDGATKNDHFIAMLATAKERGFAPTMVCFDSWYSGLDNLKAVRLHGWHFLTRLKSNRQVNPDGSGNVSVSLLAIPVEGMRVHLKGFGFVQLFRTVTKDGHGEHWATSDLNMTEQERAVLEREVFAIESYHRGLKQCCGVERCQCRGARAQGNHIVLAIRAFVRLEWHRLVTGVSWYGAKFGIVREAIRAYLANPTLKLKPIA